MRCTEPKFVFLSYMIWSLFTDDFHLSYIPVDIHKFVAHLHLAH